MRFDLVDEPWIPIVEIADGPVLELGIRECLLHAHEMQEIVDGSPLVTGSLHRLLLAVLHKVVGTLVETNWVDLWKQGSFDVSQTTDYLMDWQERGRFDLFDKDRPFYQTPDITKGGYVAITRLAHERSGMTDATLFDHSMDSDVRSVPASEAARLLVAMQAFALGGLISYDDKAHKSADAAPLSNSALVILRGESLFETLMLNLHRYDVKSGDPFETRGPDLAAWERDEPPKPEDRTPTGYVDWLTWQSRRLLLEEPVSERGELLVQRVMILKGNQLPNFSDRSRYETMVAFRVNRNAKSNDEPFIALKFNEDRALWRDSTAFLQSAKGVQSRPKTVDWLGDIRAEEPACIPLRINLDAIGLRSDQKKSLLWRHERFNLPSVYVDKGGPAGDLDRAVEFVDRFIAPLLRAGFEKQKDGAKAISVPKPVQALAEALVPGPPGEGRDNAIKSWLLSMRIEQRFWPRLEAPFRELLLRLPDDRAQDPEEDEGVFVYGKTELPRWVETVRAAAREAFHETALGLGDSARVLKAVAVSEREFERRLNAAVDGYLRQFHPREDAA